MKCPSCQSRNRPPRRFCGQCGASLVQVCARCGFSNEALNRFCGGCGQVLESAAQAHLPQALPLAPVPAPRPAIGTEMLSPQELGDLLQKPAGASPAVLPMRVTQEDLDRLFGAKP